MTKYLKQCVVYSKPLHIFDILYYNIREIEDVIVQPLCYVPETITKQY